MVSERVQRQIDRLLDEAEAAFTQRDWASLRDFADDILKLDAANQDALAFLAAAQKGLDGAEGQPHQPEAKSPAATQAEIPISFAGGRYQVKKFLGEGGKKKVYLAHDTLLDRDVAFALIKTEGLDEEARVRITREAQAMGQLGDHPRIVTIHDIGEEPLPEAAHPVSEACPERGRRGDSPGRELVEGREARGSLRQACLSGRQAQDKLGSPRAGGTPYIVAQFMPGGDVEGLIQHAEDHKVAIGDALKLAEQVCLGLEHAHGHGVVHRDLKPGNVWLTAQGVAKIGDFGLAVAVDQTRLTREGMMVGTVSYMPPEQAMGGEVTPRSDLYSLGAMLYELVTGRPPFVGDDSVAIIGQHLNTPPIAPTWHRPDCPPGLEALILRLLEKDATKRPASAKEVREALEAIAAGQTLSSPSMGEDKGGGDTRQTTDPLYRRTFVGREQELRQLQTAYDGALSGNGALLMVVGEPGIGKTAVCEQLATYVTLRGGKTLVGHCYEEGSLSLPYLAFVEAMRSYVLQREPEALKQELGTGAADVARIVSEVRDKVQVELRPSGDPEDDRWRLYQGVTSFLQNWASCPAPI